MSASICAWLLASYCIGHQQEHQPTERTLEKLGNIEEDQLTDVERHAVSERARFMRRYIVGELHKGRRFCIGLTCMNGM